MGFSREEGGRETERENKQTDSGRSSADER